MKHLFKLLIYHTRKRRKGIAFLVFFSFLITFAIARGFVIITHNSIHLIINGYHIHHITLGFISLAIAGAIAIGFKDEYILAAAVIYGIGLGLVVDEVGLLISWGDYWNRFTYDSVVIISLIFINIILFSEFWKKIGSKLFAKPIKKLEYKWQNFAKKVEEEVEWYLSGKKNMKVKLKK
jgi:hypothetical protein